MEKKEADGETRSSGRRREEKQVENVTSLTKVKLHERKEEKNDKDRGDLLTQSHPSRQKVRWTRGG